MAKRKIKYGEIVNGIFNYFAEALLSSYSALERRKGAVMWELISFLGETLKSKSSLTKKEKERKVLRVLKNLERRQIIALEEKDDKVFVYLKDKNNPKIIEYSIKKLLDFKKKKKKWDGRWFMVFFDVPEIQRNKRNYLRDFLKKLGFYQYQKSVYIFPYECEKEVALIRKIVEGAKYMRYIIAEKIEEENKIKRYFGLKN
jgi:CRISPR-associated endonuclease Cas2